MYLPSQPKHGRTAPQTLVLVYIRTHTGWLAAQHAQRPDVVEGGARPHRGKARLERETVRCAGCAGRQVVDGAGEGFRSSRSPEAEVIKRLYVTRVFYLIFLGLEIRISRL